MRYLAFPAMVLAAGAANAQQSSVTLYGIVDLHVTHAKAGDGAGGDSKTTVEDGVLNGLNGSRWGLKVSEDLGGGLRAGVRLESGFKADTGVAGQGGRLFGRHSWVSIASKSLGELRIGRQYVLEDDVQTIAIPFWDSMVCYPFVTNMGNNLPLWFNARADNAVTYLSPSFAGFTFAGQIAPGEGTADRFHGLRVVYGAGKLNAAVSYEWNKSRTGDGDVNKSLTIGANYDFGAFKLLGGYQDNEDLTNASVNGANPFLPDIISARTFTADKFHSYTVGVEVPVGAALFGANYTRSKYEGAGESLDVGKAALGVSYGLSKTTFLYAGGSVATDDLKSYISDKTTLVAGLKKAF